MSSASLFRKPLEQLIAINQEAAEQSRRAADRSMTSAVTGLLSIAVLAVAALFVLSGIVARNIVGALHLMRATIIDVAASNDFTKRSPVSGRDETAETAQAFNQLLERVQQSCGK